MPQKLMHIEIENLRSHFNGLGLVGVVLFAIAEAVAGNHPGLAADIIQILAASLTSAGIAVSAGLWVMNLLIDRRLNEFEKQNIAPVYERHITAQLDRENSDERYDRLIENLKELKEGHNKIMEKIGECSWRKSH